VNASGYSRLPSAVNFSKRQGGSNVYDELEASGLAAREVVAALPLRRQSTGSSRGGGGGGSGDR
jgi:hypothetical protein